MVQINLLKRPTVLTIGCILTLSIYLPNAAGASDTWRTKQSAALILERQQKYSQAAAAYKEVIALLPAGEDNEKAKFIAALAVLAFQQKKYNESLEYGNNAAELIGRLKCEGRMEPELLLSVQSLQEICRQAINIDSDYKVRHTLNKDYGKLALTVRQAAEPYNADIRNERIAWTRELVALHQDDEAEKELSKILKELKPGTAQYQRVQLDIAGLQLKRGHKEMTVMLKKQLSQNLSEPQVLRLLIEGQFWAGDYKTARASLDQALSKVSAMKQGAAKEGASLEILYASTYSDCSDYKTAESHLNKAIRWASKAPGDPAMLIYARTNMVAILRLQHRDSEADKLSVLISPSKAARGKKTGETYQFLLNDKETSDLENMKKTEKSRMKPGN